MAKMLSNFVQILCKNTPFCIEKNYHERWFFLRMQVFLNMESVESVCREAGWALRLKLNEN